MAVQAGAVVKLEYTVTLPRSGNVPEPVVGRLELELLNDNLGFCCAALVAHAEDEDS